MNINNDLKFNALHHTNLLILPNVSNAGEARLVEENGGVAVATSSAAVAWSFGYQDGNFLPINILEMVVKTIIRAINIPLSVDIEGGYSSEINKISELAGMLMDAGAVGINIEDGRESPDLLSRKIEAIREAAEKKNINLFINARTDIYLKKLGEDKYRLDEAIERAKKYANAGASGFFPAGLVDFHELNKLCDNISLPVNVLYNESISTPLELESIGVKRLSLGSSLSELVFGISNDLFSNFQKTGKLTYPENKKFTYNQVNNLMENKKGSE